MSAESKIQKLKARMLESLHPKFGLREASNIMAYYFDSCHGPVDDKIDKDIEALLAGVPVQYVCRNAFFYGHEFYVDERVLIPRPETEELVHWVCSENQSDDNLPVILDIGTGSGCIIISILRKLTNGQGHALDIDEAALEVCRINADKHNIELNIINKDIHETDKDTFANKFDIIVCNPPYILEEEVHRMDYHVLEHEPRHALFVEGDDPLLFYKTIIDLSPHWVRKGGKLYFETSDIYHDDLEKLLKDKGLSYVFREDMQDRWRMLRVDL